MSIENLKNFPVLVVEDSNTIRTTANVFLRQAGCVVTMAETGYDALAVIEDAKPKLIFMDILMPRLDGYQTCALLKSNPLYKDIPIVILSSKDSVFDEARGQLAGADGYMTKPFTKEDLLKVVEQYASEKV
jgi:twitching motility two-component system response regulator PilG